MNRPKNFLFLVLLLSVVAVVLAAAVLHATRERGSAARPLAAPEAVSQSVSPSPVSGSAASDGTPSAAAQRRAKEFNDATNRFNAPDDQSQ